MPSLNEVMGQLPSGKVSLWSDEQLTRYLREQYIENDEERLRMKEVRRRLDFYRDKATKHIIAMVDDLFGHPDTRKDVKKYVDLATFQNVTRRVSDELSTVYQESARRQVRKSEDKSYQKLITDVQIDAVMRRANKYVNFLNEVLVWYRVRRDDRMPVLSVITPDRFHAVSHPLDPTRLVAVIFPIYSVTQNVPQVPKYEVWTDTETFQLDKNGYMVIGSRTDHKIGSMPGVLVHRELPDTSLLDWRTGDDLISAHKAVALLNILMLREQKSGTKVPFVAGDISNTATGQAMDRDTMTVFQEGLAPGTLDLASDPNAYIAAARAVIKQVAANYGIPESVFDLSYQATSGFEIELKRVGLREKRRQQVMYPWRPAERQLAEVMSAVNERFLREHTFRTDKWSIDFGEIDAPQDPIQKLALWREFKKLGLMSVVDMAEQLNPEFDTEQARDWIRRNIAIEVERVDWMRALQSMDAGMMTTEEDPTPEDNGDAGAEAASSGPRRGVPPPGSVQ